MLHPRMKLLMLLCIIISSFLGITDAALAAMSVDMGSQYLKIGLVKPGIPMETVLNKESQRKTATLIGFHNGERFFGEPALQMSYKHPDRIIPYVTDLLGKQYDNPIVQDYIQQFPHLNITKDPIRGTPIINTKDSGSFDIETLVGMILWNAHEQAFSYGKTPVRDIVITVPSYLNQAERLAIVRAAEIADLNLLQLISDNGAAALNYAFTRRKDITEKAQNVLIYDIGASKTTATVIELKLAEANGTKNLEPVVSVKGIGFNRKLGGRALTFKLRDLLAQEFSKQHKTSMKITENPRAMAKMLKEAERVKHILSANTETYAQVESAFEDKDFRYKVNRDFINNLLKEYEAEYMKPVTDALRMAELNVDNIDQVILFGAGTRIPRIQEVLTEVFKGKEPNRFLNTDEAAAIGALYQAAHLSKGFKVKKIDLQELVTYPIQINFETAGVGESKELRRVDRTLFGYKTSYPTNRKIMTFTSHSDDFVVNLHYASLDHLSKDQLVEFGSLNITDVSFTGVAEAIKKNLDETYSFKGIKAYFLIDYFGIVRSDGADVIIEAPPEKKNSTVESIVESIGKFFSGGETKEKEGDTKEEPTTTPSPEATTEASEKDEETKVEADAKDSTKEPEKAANETQSGNETVIPETVKNDTLPPVNATQIKKEAKPKIIKNKLKLKLYNAHVDLNKDNIKSSKKALSTFERAEKLKAEREAAHNEIEARVYEIQDRLTNEEFMSWAQGNEVENLTELIKAASLWLEDEVDISTTTEQFKAKKAPIDEIIYAIEKRIIDAERAAREKERLAKEAEAAAAAAAANKTLEDVAQGAEANKTEDATVTLDEGEQAETKETQSEESSPADETSTTNAKEESTDAKAHEEF